MTEPTATISAPKDGSTLIAQPKDVESLAGSGIIESANNLKETVTGEDFNAMALAADGVAFGLDVLSMALNPLGELVKAGVGWLMEHIAFIREPLEFLTGDPKQIEALSQTWNNIAEELRKVGESYEQELSAIQGWGGEAAQAYKKVASDYTKALGAASEGARDAAKGVAIAGMVVATTRAIVFDMIASFISRIITQAIIAAASAAVTFGASLGVFISSVVAQAAVLAGKTAKRVAKVMRALQQMARKFRALGGQTGALGRALGKAANRLDGAAKSLGRHAGQRFGAINKGAREIADSGGTAASRFATRYNQWADPASAGITGTRREKLGEYGDHMATKVTKEGLKSGKDYENELRGEEESAG